LLIYFQDSRERSSGNIKNQWEAMTSLQALNQKYGADKVKQISESVTRKRNAEKTEAAKSQARADVQKYGGTLTSVGTVPTKLYGAVMAPLEYGVQAIEGTGRYKTFDPNGMGNLPNVYADAVRGQVQHNISGDVTDRAGNVVEEGGIVGDALSIGYQGVMSAADSLARAYAGGKTGALVLAASGSFGQAVTEASEKGATPVNTYESLIMTDRDIPLSLGDWLVLGAVESVEKPSDVSLDKFRITAIGDNRRGTLKHWRVSGQ
jgi:hypothetical protein